MCRNQSNKLFPLVHRYLSTLHYSARCYVVFINMTDVKDVMTSRVAMGQLLISVGQALCDSKSINGDVVTSVVTLDLLKKLAARSLVDDPYGLVAQDLRTFFRDLIDVEREMRSRQETQAELTQGHVVFPEFLGTHTSLGRGMILK
jgi:hypothetical protein